MKWRNVFRTFIIIAISVLGLQGCYTTFGSLQTSSTAGNREYYRAEDTSPQEAPVASDTIYVDEGEYGYYGDDGYRTIINNYYINNPAWRPYFDPFWDDPFYWADTRISVWVGVSYWDPFWWDPYYYPPVVVVTPWWHHRPAWGWWGYPTIVYYDPWYTPWYWDPYYSGWGWYWGGDAHRNFKHRDWERRRPMVDRGGRDYVPSRGGSGIRQPRVPGHSEPQVRQRTVHRRQIQVSDRSSERERSRTKIVRRGNRTRYTNDQSNNSSSRRSRQIIRRTRTYEKEDNQSSLSTRKSPRIIRRRSNQQYQNSDRSSSRRQESRQIRRSRSSDDQSSSSYRSRSSSRSSRSSYRSSSSSNSHRSSYRSRSSSSRSYHNGSSYRSRSSSSHSSSSGSSYRSSRSRSDDHSSQRSRTHRSRRR